MEPKYPVDKKCLIFNYNNRVILEKKFGKSFNKLKEYTYKNSLRSIGLNNFITKKIGELAYPSYASYKFTHSFYVENASIVELPISYDSSNDLADAMESKINFMNSMREIYKEMKKEFIEEDFENNVDFGSYDFSFINELLTFFYNEFKEYYIDGKLPIFIDYKDECYWHSKKSMIDYPFPKAFFLSDIENHLQNEYEIETDELYQGLLDNKYIEGRYWERFYYVELVEENFRKKKYSDKYKTIINLIKLDFKDFLVNDEMHDENLVLPIYFDYYKEILN